MKLSYFGYCIYNNSNESRTTFNISPFLNAFCNGAKVAFKNTFTYNGNNIFLINKTVNIFLFAMTRDSEIVKKINTENLTVEEIHDIFSKNEKLGFASYIYIGESFIGIASTLFAPKINTFTTFVDKLLTATGHKHLALYVSPFVHSATRQEVVAFPTVSSAKLRVDRESPLFGHTLGFLHGDDNTSTEIDYLEVRLVPKRGGEVTRAFRRLMKALPDEGLRQLTVRARGDLDEILTDYYLAGKGALADKINSREESDIFDEIRKRIKENELLPEKIDSFMQKEGCDNVEIQGLIVYHEPSPWAALTVGI